MPYRISSPPPEEPAELEEPYVKVLRRQAFRARLTGVLVLVVCAVGVAKVARGGPGAFAGSSAKAHPTPKPEAARENDARLAIAGARSRAADAQAHFEVAIRAAIVAGVSPRTDLGACPIVLPGESTSRTARLVRRGGAFPLLTIDRGELAGPLPSQAVAAVLADAQRAEAHLAAGHFEEATLYARALDRPERFTYDVVLLANTTKQVRALPGNAFEPGEIEGRAFVYDFATGRVECAADITARSSRSIGYVYSDRNDTPAYLGAIASLTDAAHDDLQQRTERAIADGLRFRCDPTPSK